jgi:hypothetical protein
MNEIFRPLSSEELKRRYGAFYGKSPRVTLEQRNVPTKLWPLLPYAEFWGLADDWTREILINEAPSELLADLKRTVEDFDDDLDEWLAGPEADTSPFSDEYIAFSAMRMAVDFI